MRGADRRGCLVFEQVYLASLFVVVNAVDAPDEGADNVVLPNQVYLEWLLDSKNVHVRVGDVVLRVMPKHPDAERFRVFVRGLFKPFAVAIGKVGLYRAYLVAYPFLPCAPQIRSAIEAGKIP